jgi:hypothetical protein
MIPSQHQIAKAIEVLFLIDGWQWVGLEQVLLVPVRKVSRSSSRSHHGSETGARSAFTASPIGSNAASCINIATSAVAVTQ